MILKKLILPLFVSLQIIQLLFETFLIKIISLYFNECTSSLSHFVLLFC